jgi:hypothetical protein
LRDLGLKNGNEKNDSQKLNEIIDDAQQMLLNNNNALIEAALRCYSQWKKGKFKSIEDIEN